MTSNEGYEMHLYRLKDTVEEQLETVTDELELSIEAAIDSLTMELSEVIGQIYDQHPRNLEQVDAKYHFASGVRMACYLIAKGFHMDPEHIRQGMKGGR